MPPATYRMPAKRAAVCATALPRITGSALAAALSLTYPVREAGSATVAAAVVVTDVVEVDRVVVVSGSCSPRSR